MVYVLKSGALTEFILVERHRVHRAPKPRSRSAALFPPFRRVVPRTQSLPAHSPLPVVAPPTPLKNVSGFSVEELALLPLAGIAAYRAVLTFLDTISVSKAALGRSRALILNGHDGVGLLALQMLKKKGVKVCVQVPEGLVHEESETSSASAPETESDPEPASSPESERTSSSPESPARSMVPRRNTVDRGVQFPDDEIVEAVQPQVVKVDVGVQTPELGPESDDVQEQPSSGDELPSVPASLKGKERERTESMSTGGDSAQRSIQEAAEKKSQKSDAESKPLQSKKERMETRLRALGADEMCVGSPLEVLQRFAKEGRSFDAILDTIGGVGIWEAAKKVLLADPFAADVNVPATEQDAKRRREPTVAQFTTTVGDSSTRAVPTSQDNFNSGLRSFRRTKSTMHHLTIDGSKSRRSKGHKRTVSYSWVNPAADVDVAGEDVRNSLAAVVRMAEDGTLKPTLNEDQEQCEEESKVVPFERAPEVFRRDLHGPRGLLKDGGACIVKIVG